MNYRTPCLIALVSASLLTAQELVLQSPLSTAVLADTSVVTGDRRIGALITIPADAPDDLGVAAFVRDREGHWFQRRWPGALTPGEHAISLNFTANDLPQSEPLQVAWRTEDAACADRAGLVFWSATHGSQTTIQIEHLVVTPLQTGKQPVALRDLDIDHLDSTGNVRSACGQRWTVRVLPAPFPANPADPAEFTLDARIRGPDGERTIPCAYVQPMRMSDRGDRQEAVPYGDGRFELRFRPSQPGIYQATLLARWADGQHLEAPLPELQVSGPAVDTLVRIDPEDHRFFRIADHFWWPMGINLHNTYDRRSLDVLSTILTPARGSLVYDAMLPRCAAAGIDACEIWLSSWNLGLEWNAKWPGFRGMGRINQSNAWRLDEVLDTAWKNGLRVNLVINNHGQAATRSDKEWNDNPWSITAGGPLAQPEAIFSDPRALAGQQRIRRYLIARYADHPAILGWKLWSEIDLTAGKGETMRRWHAQAAAAWHALDSYGHLCTTHWSGSYVRCDPPICALPDLGYLCINAYRDPDQKGTWQPLVILINDSLRDPVRGLSRWDKPVLLTEFGAYSKAPLAIRDVDHRIAGWASLVNGFAGAAMTWWWEWIDQQERWQSYRTLVAFMAGEDLRGRDASSVSLSAEAASTPLWCRAWSRKGRILGYIVDPAWASKGGDPTPLADVEVTIGDAIAPGSMTIEWWDAEKGIVVLRRTIQHQGGPLCLTTPPCAGHLAFKLWRERSQGD